MIKNYDDFINRVVNTYIDVYAPELWKDIESFKVKESKTLMQAMNEKLGEYRRTRAEKIINEVLGQIDGLNKVDKDELAYEMLNELVSSMYDTMWEYYWENQLGNLTRNLNLNFTIVDAEEVDLSRLNRLSDTDS